MGSQPDNYIITGTSGTGKSVLIQELHRRGYQVFEEAQRAILTEQLAIDGPALPAKSPAKFIAALLERCIKCLDDCKHTNGPTFFDRGIPDVTAYAIRFGVDPTDCLRASEPQQYNSHAFILSPWKEIFVTDGFRGKSFEEYFEFHQQITKCYEDAGYLLVEVPSCSVAERADFIMDAIIGFSSYPKTP